MQKFMQAKKEDINFTESGVRNPEAKRQKVSERIPEDEFGHSSASQQKQSRVASKQETKAEKPREDWDIYSSNFSSAMHKKPVKITEGRKYPEDTLVSQSKMIPLELFDEKNVGYDELTMTKLHQLNIGPVPSQKSQPGGDILDKLVSKAESNRPSSQTYERMTEGKVGVNYYNMNKEPVWNKKEESKPASRISSASARPYAPTFSVAGKNVLGGNSAVKGTEITSKGIEINNSLFSLPSEGSKNYELKEDEKLDLKDKRADVKSREKDVHKEVDVFQIPQNESRETSFQIEKLHEINEARLRDLEKGKFEDLPSKWFAHEYKTRESIDHLSELMKDFDEEGPFEKPE